MQAFSGQATQSVWQQMFNLAFYLEHFSLSVCADDARHFETVKAFVGAHCLTSAPAVESLNAALVIFYSHAAPPALPAVSPSPLKVAQGTAYLDGQRIFLAIDDGVLIVENEPAAPLQVYLPTGIGATAIGLLFTHALHAALRRAHLFDLHAAAVTSPAGTGMLFIGDSGSGKSTLTLRLAGRGWRYLSDDSLLLRQEAERLFVTPLRRVFALLPQTLAACGLRDLIYPGLEEKRSVEPATLFPAGHIACFEPRHLVFPKLTQQPRSALAPLTQANAMMRLLYHSPWACFDTLTSRAHLERLTHLAQSTQAWELNAGRDLLEEPEAAAALLADL